MMFYAFVTAQSKGGLGGAISCLYSTEGACGFVQGMAHVSGTTPYTPIVFWIGVGTLALGIISKLVHTVAMDDSDKARASADNPMVDAHASLEAMTKKCPQCAEQIKLEAFVCRYCGQRFAAEDVKTQVETARLELDRTSVRASAGEWTTCLQCKQLIRPDPTTMECYLCHCKVVVERGQ